MLLLAFFEEYSNDKIPEVDKRLEIPYKMIKENILPKEDFLKEFNEFLSRSWEIASDIPYLVISLAKIFILFVKNNICKFHDLEIFSSSANEDYEDVICFIKEFIEAAFKLLKEKVIN